VRGRIKWDPSLFFVCFFCLDLILNKSCGTTEERSESENRSKAEKRKNERGEAASVGGGTDGSSQTAGGKTPAAAKVVAKGQSGAVPRGGRW